MSDLTFPFAPAQRYADGGYPFDYIMGDGESLCANCVNDPTNPVRIVSDISHCDIPRMDTWESQWTIVAVEIIEDSSLAPNCAHCGRML
jgi:hypothetical protein